MDTKIKMYNKYILKNVYGTKLIGVIPDVQKKSSTSSTILHTQNRFQITLQT